MKVKELIEELQKQDQSLDVFFINTDEKPKEISKIAEDTIINSEKLSFRFILLIS